MMKRALSVALKGLLLAALMGSVGPVNTPAQSVHAPAEGKEPAHRLLLGRVADELQIDMVFAWDSRYVLEGRDMLDGEDLVGTTVDALYRGVDLGAWYAASPGTEYTEFNAYLNYTVEYGDWEASVGYMHLRFLSDDEEDNEVGASLAYGGIPGGLTAHADWYHSFEAEGSFVEAVLGGGVSLVCTH